MCRNDYHIEDNYKFVRMHTLIHYGGGDSRACMVRAVEIPEPVWLGQ